MIRLLPPVPVGSVESLGIGVFDGLHVGHQEIVQRANALLTFYPHPDSILGKGDIKYLTVLNELRRLNPALYVMAFDVTVAKMAPDAFLDFAVRNAVNPKRIVVGEDFRFGAKQAGDIHYLIDWALTCGIEVDVVPLKHIGETAVKSSLIRDLLRAGKLEAAAEYLGRPYLLIGQVIRGEGRGHNLGYPTANIQVDALKLVPKSGIYSGYVTLGSASKRAMIYIGSKPTFSDLAATSIEVFLTDYSGDLYDQQLEIWIEKHIRDDQKFESAEALSAQIQRDIAMAFPSGKGERL